MSSKEILTENSSVKTYVEWQCYPWIMWGIGAAFFFLEYVVRVCPSVMITDLMTDFSASAKQMGLLSSYFYYPYVLMQMAVGGLVDKYGPRRLLVVTIALCTLGSALFGFAHVLWMAKLARFLTGFAGAFAFVIAMKLATIWFPSSRFGFFSGLTQVLGMLGAAAGESIIEDLHAMYGWRVSVSVITLLLLTLMIVSLFLSRDKEDNKNVVNKSQAISLWDGYVTVLKNPQSWFNGIYAGLIFMPMAVFELWGPECLKATQGMLPKSAAIASSLMFIGWAVGGSLAGWLSDKIKRRTPLLSVSSVLSLICLCVILYVPSLSNVLIYFFCFLFGVVNTGLIAAYALSGEINPSRVSGISIAFANMMSVIVGAVFHPIFGWILDVNWDGTMQANVKIYGVDAYYQAVIILPIALVLSFIFSYTVKETFCKPVDE